MSDTNDATSKTEEPTPRKLQQARERGEVVKTPDLPTMASLAAAATVVALGGGYLSRNLVTALTPFLASPDAMSLEGHGGMQIMRAALMAAVPAVGAVILAACAAGVAGNLVQTGFVFSPERLAFDPQKFSPVAGFKRIFGIDGFVQFLKSLLKVFLTGLLAWWVLNPHLKEMENLASVDPIAMLGFAADILRRLVFAVAVFLTVVAGGDWFWQRQRFMNKMKMTKEELKEDFKQSEGDPHIKAKQRQMRNARAKRRMMAEVAKATVVVMNPTHYAVALKYDASETPAPMCVAKGLDSLALKIREIAEAAGVPVIEDPPLARALYAAVDIDEIIPPAHYEAVAKIIGFILSAGRKVAARSLRGGGL
ncbi:MAG TPA: flagellar biosynthesis protein FlhB [Phenylobacterium sp.]|jgi:flagellar biosynthetic protein FlhB|uniref:flagellar biosynthesis protein FlhB n=1 Tax=Phenylobacterium sp. TaxID=1871053 RepID=UPI002C04DA39|nr:flagellar biosynthesis protein FlhB [Phenylobacterium sp.]HXA37596.1 flagellar biosynthesis protein FlhB [Phenylobacterium sp.]